MLASGIDVVLLASPPGFRPAQIEKAVQHGVHVFAEKPIATDAPGVRRVRAACEVARQKGLSIVSGLCYRYHDGRRALVQRLQDGAIGEITAIQGNYITGELWSFARQPQWSELEWQLRNWLYYPWLSGDLIAEQHIHTLDVMAWALRASGQLREARSFSDRALAEGTRDARLFYHAGVIASEAGDHSRARHLFAQADAMIEALLPSERRHLDELLHTPAGS